MSGVHGLSVFNSTVWGEADCFVQYHFPHVTEQQSGEEEEGEVEGEDGAGVLVHGCSEREKERRGKEKEGEEDS